MNLHANSRTGAHSRLLVCQRVQHLLEPLTAGCIPASLVTAVERDERSAARVFSPLTRMAVRVQTRGSGVSPPTSGTLATR